MERGGGIKLLVKKIVNDNASREDSELITDSALMKSVLHKFGATEKVNDNTNRDKNVLKKELTLFSGTMYVVGNIIGSGIFITPRDILSLSGSFGLSLVLWIIGGILAVGGGLCFIELSLLIKKSGGEYCFLKEAYSFKKKYKIFEVFGGLLGFLFIWCSLFVIRASALAIIVLTCAQYLLRPVIFFMGCDHTRAPESAVKLLSLALLGKSNLICSSINYAIFRVSLAGERD